jgi:hypothetical protein
MARVKIGLEYFVGDEDIAVHLRKSLRHAPGP